MEETCDRLAKQSREVRDFTLNQALGDRYNNDVVGQVNAVLAFVKDRVRYVRDPINHEYIQSPLGMVRDIQKNGYCYGDCEDHVMLFNCMLGSIGIDTKPVGVKLNKSITYNHVISTVLTNRGWIDLDPCAKNTSQPFYDERLVYA